MSELERFRLTRLLLLVPFGFNLLMVAYFFMLSFLLMMGGGPYENDSFLWQLLTLLPPASFVINGLSIPVILFGLYKDFCRPSTAGAVAMPPGRGLLWGVFLVAGLLCTGMLYIFVFIPSAWGWLTGEF